MPTSFQKPEVTEFTGARRKGASSDITVFGPKSGLSYYGGRVISNVNVVVVDWTSSVDALVAGALPGFFTTITASPYFTWLAEYNTVGLTGAADGLPGSNQTIGYGTYDSTYVIAPTVNTTTTVDNSDISAELDYQLGAGLLPAPELDAAGNVNSLYVFEFPADYTVTLFGATSCSAFCGYHFTLQYGPSLLSVPYAVLMDVGPGSPCDGGCGPSKDYVDNATSVHSHELVEAITDTEAGLSGGIGRPLAWYDDVDSPGGEAADICVGVEAVIETYTVQEIWSNANAACIAVAPLCDGVTTPPACTPCTAADDGVGCNGATSWCETDSKNSKFGQCVACAIDSNCGGAASICNKSTGSSDDTCRECVPSDCKGSASVCSTSGFEAGHCVECDATDTSACPMSKPYCDTLSFTCVGCIGNKDCSGGAPICDYLSLSCRACATNDECAPDVCDTSSGACVQCLSSTDCESGTCNLSSRTCQCDTSSQCSNPSPVCGPAKTCVACKSDADCAGNSAGGACAAGSCVGCTKSADCMAPTPVCDTSTNVCHGAGDAGTDGSALSPIDSSAGKTDSGSAEGGPHGGSQGCATAPQCRARRPRDALVVLLTAVLVAMGARRRRATRSRTGDQLRPTPA